MRPRSLFCLRLRARQIAGFAFACFLGLAVSASAAPRWRSGPDLAKNLVLGFAALPLASDALRPVERTFLEKAAASSRQQMRLAKLALSQAVSSDIRTYAQQIASDNRQLNDSVEDLLRKKGISPDQIASDVATETYTQLAVSAGSDFDREFLRLAGDMHGNALTLFEEVMADAKDEDVRELVGTYLPVLRNHRNRGTELAKMFD